MPIEKVDHGATFLRFRSAGKEAVLLWQDNNHALDCLQQAGLRVHHFVGICDGCSEGGNYECVHERPFVHRLLQVAANGMRYTTDHSPALQTLPKGEPPWSDSRRKFVIHMPLSKFPRPTKYRRSPPAVEDYPVPSARFELQGVLIRTHEGQEKFSVLGKGRGLKTQLEELTPFRAIGRRGILAEYRVYLSERPTRQICV